MFNAEKEIGNIIEQLKKYKENTKCQGVVLGISGGKDSTVVAMLAKLVWGDNVYAVLMPNGEQKDITDSYEIVHVLKLNYQVIDIYNIYEQFIRKVEPTIKACTNIPPRIRMTLLYAIAQTMGYRVIGTGNLSEAYIGWTTKWGDSAYDINPIGNYTCTEVMEIGKVLAPRFNLDKRFVTKVPSDGLCGKTDEDSFGFTYKTLDKYIRGELEGLDKETIFKIEEMHRYSEHKRNMPVVLTKEN